MFLNITEVSTVFPDSNSYSQSHHSSCAQAFDEYPSRRRVSVGAEHMLLLCIASFRPGELNEDGEGEVRPNEMTNGLAFLLSHQTQGALTRVWGEARGNMCLYGAGGKRGRKQTAHSLASHTEHDPPEETAQRHRCYRAQKHKLAHTQKKHYWGFMAIEFKAVSLFAYHTLLLPENLSQNSSEDYFWKLIANQYASGNLFCFVRFVD